MNMALPTDGTVKALAVVLHNIHGTPDNATARVTR